MSGIESPSGETVTGAGEFLAIVPMIGCLSAMYDPGSIRVLLSNEVSVSFANEWQKQNLVLLGGPRVNPIAHRVMEYLELPYRFEEDALTDRADRVRWEAEMDLEGNPTVLIRDWALAAKKENPFAAGKRVYIMAGLHSCGTSAAASAMFSPPAVALLNDSADPESFALLIEASRVGMGTIFRVVEPFKSDSIVNQSGLLTRAGVVLRSGAKDESIG